VCGLKINAQTGLLKGIVLPLLFNPLVTGCKHLTQVIPSDRLLVGRPEFYSWQGKKNLFFAAS
jgi:hypothetical protein